MYQCTLNVKRGIGHLIGLYTDYAGLSIHLFMFYGLKVAPDKPELIALVFCSVSLHKIIIWGSR